MHRRYNTSHGREPADWRLAILAAERRYKFSHGREPVVFDWHSALAPREARGWEVVEIPIHGLAPVAKIVSPLRG